MKLFTYGSLMDNNRRFEVLGRNIEGKKDILDNWKLTKHSVFYDSYPAIIPQNGEFVKGIVFDVNNNDLIKLDRYETILYKKIKVLTKNNIECLVYIENQFKLKCDLCQMEFKLTKEGQADLGNSLKRHNEWHMKARIQKRNTTQGTPKYNRV